MCACEMEGCVHARWKGVHMRGGRVCACEVEGCVHARWKGVCMRGGRVCACEVVCACGEYNTCKCTPAIEHAWGSVSMHLSQLGMSVQLLLLHACHYTPSTDQIKFHECSFIPSTFVN